MVEPSVDFQDEFNQFLRPLIGTFGALPARIVDTAGNETPEYCSVIHCNGNEHPAAVPIDDVAAVVDFYEDLTHETLASAYMRAKALKSIEKIGREEPETGNVSMTTVMVVSRTTSLSLEQIAATMQRLNAEYPSNLWPDAVAVLDRGIVNYTAQVPGRDSRGDFFLPSFDGPANQPTPSLYVQQVIRATGSDTLKKVAALIMARVAIFEPGIRIPNYNDLLTDLSRHGMAAASYQFNLSYHLAPVLPQQAIAARLPQTVFNIVSGGKKLGSIQFLEWQDGGVIIVRDDFPIDLFLVFAQMAVPALAQHRFSYVRQNNLQVSYVLPIKWAQFLQILTEFQQRSSNISLIPETSKYLVQKYDDEGSTSPFLTRFMLSMLTIRDGVYDNAADRDKFDDLYDHVLSGLRAIRESHKEIVTIWTAHKSKVDDGSIVQINGRQVTINESIDRAMRREFEAFVNSSARTLKHSLQTLVKFFGFDIGFLFGKESQFLSGVAAMEQKDPLLAAYLMAARQWTEPLVLLRNDLEHGTVDPPKVQYQFERRPVVAIEPLANGKPITTFTGDIMDRLFCVVEELVVYCLKQKLPSTLTITEIALSERNPDCPERFNLTVTPGGRPPWILMPHSRTFEQT